MAAFASVCFFWTIAWTCLLDLGYLRVLGKDFLRLDNPDLFLGQGDPRGH